MFRVSFLRNDGSGTSGGGTFDILGPNGTSGGQKTVAARPGDDVVLFGFGFGPTNPAVPAGHTFSGAAPIVSTMNVYINNVPVKTTFIGISSAGLYQINLRIPSGLGVGDVPLLGMVNGLQTQPGVLIPLQLPENHGGYAGTYVPVMTSHPVQFFSTQPAPGNGTFNNPPPTNTMGSGGGAGMGTGGMGSGQAGGGQAGSGQAGSGQMGSGQAGSGGMGGGSIGGGSFGTEARRSPWHPKLKFPPKGK